MNSFSSFPTPVQIFPPRFKYFQRGLNISTPVLIFLPRFKYFNRGVNISTGVQILAGIIALEHEKHSVTPRRFPLSDMLFFPSRTGYFYPHGQFFFALTDTLFLPSRTRYFYPHGHVIFPLTDTLFLPSRMRFFPLNGGNCKIVEEIVKSWRKL